MRLKLLPNDPILGKAPYFWLVYLGFYFWGFFYDHSRPTLLLGGVVLLMFLGLYFRCFWLQGGALFRNSVLITLLGLFMLPLNVGATCFLIYSACMAAGFESAMTGVALIAFNVAVGVVVSLLLKLNIAIPIQIVLLVPTVSGFALYQSVTERTRQRKQQQQEELAHLAKIAERERVARDLHDVLGHTLSVVVTKSELARKLVTRDPNAAVREMTDVERTARAALLQVREAIAGYRTAGFTHELEQASSALAAAGVVLKADVEPFDLLPSVENALALAFREAVTNIVRHARASACRVGMRQTGTEVLCTVDDDGVGMRSSRDGFGLRGMRERIEHLGGSLKIESATPSGTRLVFSLPLRPALEMSPQ
ncbi:MAG: sensor histidine kinase [Burkholderiales bacterium]|nr:sensor histidine kinase [Burkholderiales bacterium]